MKYPPRRFLLEGEGIRAKAGLLAGVVCVSLIMLLGAGAIAQERAIAPAQAKSGSAFVSDDIRAMQSDDLANPGMLWVTRGEKLWSEPRGKSARSCASCHKDARGSMQGIATRYPVYDRNAGRLLSLEGRINNCLATHQGAEALRYESDDLLAFTAYIGYQSHGMPVKVSIDGDARKHFDAGRELYYKRVGQMNLACANCHEANWGKRLFAETISQGQSNAFPLYRLEWQTLGSLHRRLRACFNGVRAEPYPAGSQEFLDLELFLAWRAQGLPIETPAVRR